MALRFRRRLRVVSGSGLSYRSPKRPPLPPPDTPMPLSTEPARRRLLFRLGVGATIAAGAVYLTH
jgi:hypothetical protein